MLSSAGFFDEIDCPFFRRDLCERPHCLYKHAKEEWAMFDTLHESSITVAALKSNPSTVINGSPERKETGDTCLLELERINKEIETVKSEVEKEQRRLSQYQTIQVECTNTGFRKVSVSKPESEGKDLNGNRQQHALKLPSKSFCPVGKYVVDNSKPRTDLEYDPLSNFSADLRCSGSADYKVKPHKEQKLKNVQGVKRHRDTVYDDPKKTPSHELAGESEDEGVLIIDVPLSPDQNARAPKPQKVQEVQEGVHKVGSVSIIADIPTPLPVSPLVIMVKPQSTISDEKEKVVNIDDTEHLPSDSVCQSNNNQVNAVSVFDDLSKCLEDLRSESDRIVRYQESVTTGESECGTEPDWLKTQSCSQILKNSDVPVKESVTPLNAEPDLLENELSSINVHHHVSHYPVFSSSHQHTMKGQICEQQPAQSMAQSHWSPLQNSKILGPIERFDFVPAIPVLPSNYLEQAASTASITQSQPCQPPLGPSTSQSHTANGGAGASAALFEQLVLDPVGSQLVENVDQISEEELNYSDMELSDSDPMEECYRIFMEANKDKEEASTSSSCPGPPVGRVDVETPEIKVKPKVLQGQRKRVAHVSKLPEPVAKTKPQVIVPLQGSPAPQQAPLSRIQQLQQKASMLTSALKGGQAFVSSTTQRKVLTLVPPHTPPPYTYSTPVQNACMKVIPLGHAIKVGNSLHFILPEGSYAVPISSVTTGTQVVAPVTPLLSTITPVAQPAVPPVFRPAHPVSTPVTPVHTPPVNHLPVPPQPAAYIPAKPISTKRKAKLRPDISAKVPHDVRQRYVNLFVEEFLKTSSTVQEAFEKALAEEKTVYDRSINKLRYLSVAVNALKRLKNQSTTTAKVEHEASDQMSRGKIPLNIKTLKGNADAALYESLKEHVLSDESLIENNYPLQHPELPGTAILYADTKKGTTDPLKKICCRCGATYSVGQTGKHSRREECTYHYGKGVKNKVPGGVETRYSCCEGVVGTPGCQVFKLHVHDAVSLEGFVRTLPKPASENACSGVYAVDTEMCYTTHGLDLARVTVVNSCLQVIYDTFVKPEHEIIDYNTRFSGVSKDDVNDASPSIRDVQKTLLSFVYADTILIGHNLETDLCALKLLHGMVVDTSVVFPHRLGLPHKLTLHSLTTDYLRRIIQESVGGHDTAEDASACMELMLWKVKEDGKVKRW